MSSLKQMQILLSFGFASWGILFGQETQWLKKNLGNAEEVYQFSVKDGLSPHQLRQKFPIRFEIEWTY